MTRNSESHFATLPDIDIERSVMDLSHGYMTTCDCGQIIPVMCKEVLAGDTWEIETSIVCRAQTMLTPIFSNINLDYYYFFVPFRLMWTHFPEFFGENTSSAWVQSTEYSIPTISSPSGGFAVGTLADYLGYPVGVEWSATDKLAPSALPFRGYALIVDQWFRSENVTDPLNIPLGDSNQTGTNGGSYINDVANGGLPFLAAKYHDYFTSALPSAQKASSPVTFGTDAAVQVNGLAPVGTTVYAHDSIGEQTYNPGLAFYVGNSYNYNYRDISLHPVDTTGPFYGSHGSLSRGSDDKLTGFNGDPTSAWRSGYPVNLWADLDDALSVSGVSFNINDLRLAFQLQKFYEKQARGGSRFIEVLRQHFGVTSPDARLQRPEYLGGKRVPLMIHEVTNSAQTSTDFLGDVGAKLSTSDKDWSVQKSFVEPGYLYCLAVIRYPHAYPQGIDRQYLRKTFEQFYWPTFANIGEQPLFDAELYATSTSIANDTVFGYQEAWADYRYSKDICTASMRPGVSGSLASWHLADYYTSKPTLSDGWLREDKGPVDRVLAVTSAVANQFFMDFWFKCKTTRPMPVYSIPGLIDHH